MKATQYTKITLKGLIELRAKIDDEIEKRRAQIKSNLLAKFAQDALDAGLDPDEMLGTINGKRPGKKSKSKGTVLPPKYCHPEDPRLSWTGRGRRPKWLVELEAKGGKAVEIGVD